MGWIVFYSLLLIIYVGGGSRFPQLILGLRLVAVEM
jgi:hypothetical protein